MQGSELGPSSKEVQRKARVAGVGTTKGRVLTGNPQAGESQSLKELLGLEDTVGDFAQKGEMGDFLRRWGGWEAEGTARTSSGLLLDQMNLLPTEWFVEATATWAN